MFGIDIHHCISFLSYFLRMQPHEFIEYLFLDFLDHLHIERLILIDGLLGFLLVQMRHR
jgi:hypothetical protein